MVFTPELLANQNIRDEKPLGNGFGVIDDLLLSNPIDELGSVGNYRLDLPSSALNSPI
jgi:hypothetical protein